MMKTCSIFCYYEGYNTKGDILCNGNHTCDVEYSHNVAGVITLKTHVSI